MFHMNFLLVNCRVVVLFNVRCSEPSPEIVITLYNSVLSNNSMKNSPKCNTILHCSLWLMLFCSPTLLCDICHMVYCTFCTHRCNLFSESSFLSHRINLPLFSTVLPSFTYFMVEFMDYQSCYCATSCRTLLLIGVIFCSLQQELHSQLFYLECSSCQSWDRVCREPDIIFNYLALHFSNALRSFPDSFPPISLSLYVWIWVILLLRMSS